MENFYTCYTKVLQGTTYYFAKKYITFPEHNNVPDVLDGYGMHTDFNKACHIAKIEDDSIKQMLLQNVQADAQAARVIRMNREVRKAN